jgi:hypothetical protein
MSSLSSNKIVNGIAGAILGLYMGLMFYSAITVVSESSFFNKERSLALMYLIVYGLGFLWAAVGSTLKAVTKKNVFETLVVPVIFALITFGLGLENLIVLYNEVNIVVGALALCAFAVQVVAIVMWCVSEHKINHHKYNSLDKLPKALFTGANVVIFVFAILALIGSLSSHPLIIFAMVCLLLSPIISTINVWTIKEDMYTPSTSIFGSKVKINIKKQTSSTPNNNSNTKAEFSDSEIETMINKNTYTLDDLKVAKQMFEAGKISAQDYEVIKNKYVSTI